MKKKIILGVTGSIAAYKACDLARLFMKGGCDVHVVLTENAEKLVTALTFTNLTGNIARTEMWRIEHYEMSHISLKENADLFITAPATANIIAKFACGIADDLLSTTYLSVNCPVIIAPAMNPSMYAHPATAANIRTLTDRGVIFAGPETGTVACGDMGKGKMSDPEVIYEKARSILGI